MQSYLHQRPLLVIPTALIVASIAILGYPTMRAWGLEWLDELRLRYQLRKLKNPVPMNIDRWRCRAFNLHDQDVLYREIEINNSWWDFLTAAWSNRGYTLYVLRDPGDIRTFVPSPVNGQPSGIEHRSPYARRSYEKNEYCRISWTPCIRGARDNLGRDVVIRIVSNKSQPTTELHILRYLRSSIVSQDPRNITIPVVDEQDICGLIFIVMPLWDDAWIHEFETVTELMDAAEILLKYLVFLHEHRIAHMDLHAGNTAINTTVSSFSFHLKGLRDPKDTRYAVYDFGESYMYPRDTPLDSVEEVLDGIGWGLMGLVEPNVPFNPFRVDVAAMGRLLASRVRVLQDDIPEVVPFFTNMQDSDPTKRPTAHEALLQFQHIRLNLTLEQVAAPVCGTSWHSTAGITYKKEYKHLKKKKK